MGWKKEQIIEAFQRQGKRVTKQRKLMLDVILKGDWVSCKDIYYEVRKKDSSIGLATVYRMVESLEEMGVLVRCSRYSFLPVQLDEEEAGE